MSVRRSPVLEWFCRTGTALGLLLTLPSGAGRAAEHRSLPALELTTLRGRPVSGATLAYAGPWLLIYAQAGSEASQGLLGVVAADTRLRSRGAIVVVVAGRARQAAELAARFPRLTGAAWYSDPSHSLPRQLGLAGAPVVLGVRGEVVEWSLTGVLADVDHLRSILATWTAR
jgi:hypothetical protein